MPYWTLSRRCKWWVNFSSKKWTFFKIIGENIFLILKYPWSNYCRAYNIKATELGNVGLGGSISIYIDIEISFNFNFNIWIKPYSISNPIPIHINDLSWSHEFWCKHRIMEKYMKIDLIPFELYSNIHWYWHWYWYWIRPGQNIDIKFDVE